MWKGCLLTPHAMAETWGTRCRHCDVLCVFSMLPVQTKTRPPCGYHPNHRHSYSECLFVALRLRRVERRGHTESLTKLIRQIPVTSKTFAPLRSSARALWTAAAISVICLLPICIPLTTSTSFSPWLQALGARFLFFLFLAFLFNTWTIYALHKLEEFFE